MNKTELVEYISNGAEISKAAAAKALDAVVGGVTDTIKEGEKITIPGLGTFSKEPRAARTGRNPQTGEAINIPACNVPKF